MLELETPVFGTGIIYGQSSTPVSRNGPAKEPPRERLDAEPTGRRTHTLAAHIYPTTLVNK